MARPERVSCLPLLTLTLAGAALLAFCSPGLTAVLVYDRAAILSGEFWRLASAPLVHFSLSHLGWNLAVFCAAGWLAESADRQGFRVVCAFAFLVAGPYFLLADADLLSYGGLSGVATAALTYLCLLRLRTPASGRWAWMLLLLLIGVKILAEIYSGQPFFAASLPGYRVLPAAHLLGVGGALLVALGPSLGPGRFMLRRGRQHTQWRRG